MSTLTSITANGKPAQCGDSVLTTFPVRVVVGFRNGDYHQGITAVARNTQGKDISVAEPFTPFESGLIPLFIHKPGGYTFFGITDNEGKTNTCNVVFTQAPVNKPGSPQTPKLAVQSVQIAGAAHVDGDFVSTGIGVTDVHASIKEVNGYGGTVRIAVYQDGRLLAATDARPIAPYARTTHTLSVGSGSLHDGPLEVHGQALLGQSWTTVGLATFRLRASAAQSPVVSQERQQQQMPAENWLAWLGIFAFVGIGAFVLLSKKRAA